MCKVETLLSKNVSYDSFKTILCKTDISNSFCDEQ